MLNISTKVIIGILLILGAIAFGVWKGVLEDKTIDKEIQLKIDINAPATAKLNEEFDYNIVVKNVGTSVARNVMVEETLPPEVTHPGGARLHFMLGDLAAGASKTFIIRVKAVQTGTAINMFKVTSENSKSVKASAKTVIE